MAKLELFVNGVFTDFLGDPKWIPCRVRGGRDKRTWKLPAAAFSTLPEKHDGIAVEVSGRLRISGNYVVPENCRVIDIRPGAGQPAGERVDLDAYLAELAATNDNDVPF